MVFELIIAGFAILLLAVFIKNSRRGHGSLPPGPTPLPIIGHFHLLGPLIHHSFRDLCSSYGPLIYLRLGSVPCVVASTPELAKELLKTNDLTFSSRKHSLAIDHLTYSSSFAFSPYGPYWRFIKKMSTFEFLGNRALNQFLPIRRKELREFLGVVHDKSKVCDSVNVTEELLKLSSNIISQIILSLRCSGTDNEAEGVRTLVREVTQMFGEFNVSDFFWFCRNFDFQGYRKKFEDVHRRYDALLEKVIRNREIERKNKSPGGEYKARDLLDMMLDALEDKSSEVELTREHIKALVLAERFLKPDGDMVQPASAMDIKGQHSSDAVKIKGNAARPVDMTERPGLTAPRFHELVCAPVPRPALDSLQL
ncbi:FLAVONOID 3'-MONOOXYGENASE-RELATED [Salix koriyanagi]|uniref:FLAVONOID 3'-MONOOXYGENASE-RELATED n=1 Tax=Salix koriyanagi TaxID=2511006 RepID=A0A9Q0VYB6_9ROSI|nr:FLAVONOID 3'-MONOOXYGENASE-RELATED [Salix koriyanagi]